MMRRMKNQRGFTLVELMIVVAIIGILAALAVYGVKRYLTSAKTAEAKEMLGRLGKDATAAYQRERMAGGVLPTTGGEDSTAQALHQLCPDAPKTPATTPKNAKFQTAPADWKEGDGAPWTCLRFSISDPTYYSYEYDNNGTDEAPAFEAKAYGDLDADESDATFILAGAVTDGEARLAPTIQEPEAVENSDDE